MLTDWLSYLFYFFAKKWQGLAMLLAMVLRGLGPDREDYYDSDEEYIPARLPLLRNHQNSTYVTVDPQPRNDHWYLKVNDNVITLSLSPTFFFLLSI